MLEGPLPARAKEEGGNFAAARDEPIGEFGPYSLSTTVMSSTATEPAAPRVKDEVEAPRALPRELGRLQIQCFSWLGMRVRPSLAPLLTSLPPAPTR